MVKIAILGCGLLGVKVAGEMAYHGHRVKMYDCSVLALNSAYQRIEEDKRFLNEEGLLTHRNYIGQILCMSRLEETVNDADFILECIAENLEAKKDLFERVSHLCKQQAVIASSTLRLSLKEITERTTFKERTLGLRFLFPVHYIPEVEITPGPYTSTQVIERVRVLIEKMGKTLFFRSGGEPLILSEEQREERLKARQEQINNSSGVAFPFDSYMPALSHRGNHPPLQDDDASTMKSEEKECAICMDRNRDCLLCPCHHLVTCYKCSSMLLNRRDACPICRTDITELINVYLS